VPPTADETGRAVGSAEGRGRLLDGLTRREVLRGAVAGAGIFALEVWAPVTGMAQSLARGGTLRSATRLRSPHGTIDGLFQADAFEVGRGETLRFDPTVDTTLEVRGNVVVLGRLEMRPEPGVEHVLRFIDVDETAFVGGGLDPLDSDVGLWVMGRGQLDIQGTGKPAWNRTGNSPRWRGQDELIVAPVAPGDFQPRPFVKGAPVPTFGERRAEVLNLTRNARIEGTPGGRAHVFIRSSKPQSIRHAEFRYLGPRQAGGESTEGVLGRYPLHFHHAHGGSRGSVIQGVVVRDAGNHAFVPHMSHGITFRSCIAYEVFEDAYWWDPGDATDDLVFERCIAASIHSDPEQHGLRLSGFVLAMGEGQRLRRCVAFAVQGGRDASGYIWPEAGDSGLWEFTDNIAHNNAHAGIFVWQNNGEPHTIDRFTAYNNGSSGIRQGAYQNAYHYADLDLRDQPLSIELLANGKRDPSGRPMSWTDVQGTSLVVQAHSSHLVSDDPVLFLRCSFPAGVTLNDGGGAAGPLDFLDCELGPESFSVLSLNPDTVVRVQNTNGTAFQLTVDGVRDIAVFRP
jgi:hypothetical protein